MASDNTPYIQWFSDIGLADVELVGGKNASLGELYRDLRSEGVRVPNGFALTVNAYHEHLRVNHLQRPIDKLLEDLDTTNVPDLTQKAAEIRLMISSAPLPEQIAQEVVTAYRQLCGSAPQLASVAVRSSATAEDLPEASFAGQQETYLNVQGELALIDACKHCLASLFTDRAIVYRSNLGIANEKIGLSVGVQQMVRSDLASAGVMFTLDTETGFRDVVMINSSLGLGETVVQGTVIPDEFVVFKPTLIKGFQPILQKRLGSKEFKTIYDVESDQKTKTIATSKSERLTFSLTDEEVMQLSRWGIAIENHYRAKYARDIPMDIEWAKDGVSGDLYIVQARPETVHARKSSTDLEIFRLKKRSRILCRGRSIGEKIGHGRVRVIHDLSQIDTLIDGEILVAETTTPDWEPVLKRAAGVVTDTGGRTCHAAIVSRELGIPAVVGTIQATTKLSTGDLVTVSCAEGEVGIVYEGLLEHTVEKVDLSKLRRPKTKIMLNIANPDEAFRLSFLPNDGVGLAREEFIINHHVKIHPMALIHFDRVSNESERNTIREMTEGYSDKSMYFVERLSQGIATLAAAFYPKDVILRFSDFKTNEYANLIGGRDFEPHEENPMIGFRGASRFYNERYREGFGLECQAIRRVRDEMGLNNLKVMIPFCRTIDEGHKVLTEMQKHGLRRGENGLEIYVMCEIPSNVILAHEFARLFDGFSIGSNDLTQLVLGVDRNSEIVADLFDERNPAVKQMLANVVSVAKVTGRKIGICGQAPSDFSEIAEFLVQLGVDSLSLNPDSILKVTRNVSEFENRLGPEFENSQARAETRALQ